MQVLLLHLDFNPHSHEESDLYEGKHEGIVDISIHTLTKRVTIHPVNQSAMFNAFQSTLSRRE